MQKSLTLRDKDEIAQVLGVLDCNLRAVREETGAKILVRGTEVHIGGSKQAVERAYDAFVKIRQIVSARGSVTKEELDQILLQTNGKAAEETNGLVPQAAPLERPGVFRKQALVNPKSEGQKLYLDEIETNDIVFCVGPAGTGKTFLAVCKAIEYLRAGKIRRLVLVRPAVEAGEKLGYLPGDIIEKVNPYLRPIYDSLNFFLEYGQLKRLIDNDIIEIVPLAFMRGRTLDEAFIILDEAQNTTSEQMKMFLTRMGLRSKVVVTGDVTQIDLAPNKTSGLIEAKELFKGILGIGFVSLTKQDIVRHPLVQKIVEAYERKKR